MKITFEEGKKIIEDILVGWGFNEPDAQICARNMIEADRYGKKSHGMANLFWYKTVVDGEYGPINLSEDQPMVTNETVSTMVIDGCKKTGYVVMDFAIKKAMEKMKSAEVLSVALTNTAPTIGYLGSYAREISNNGYIFICFSNARKSTAPYGTMKKLIGTNPVACGIPTGSTPVILDMATAASTYSRLLQARAHGVDLKENVGLDATGNLSSDPNKILDGGMIMPFGGYKGSGLALIVELLAGALTGSTVGSNGRSSWGTFFIVINPEAFGNREEFHKQTKQLIEEIKTAPKRPGIEGVFYPGEKSQLFYEQTLKSGYFEVDDDFSERLKKIK